MLLEGHDFDSSITINMGRAICFGLAYPGPNARIRSVGRCFGDAAAFRLRCPRVEVLSGCIVYTSFRPRAPACRLMLFHCPLPISRPLPHAVQ